jgi:hypothetical protein
MKTVILDSRDLQYHYAFNKVQDTTSADLQNKVSMLIWNKFFISTLYKHISSTLDKDLGN